MTADEQLLAILATNGHHNADGIGRAARIDRCPDCRAHILVGLDADRCALAARVDPHEIDPVGEYLALRIGIPTYNLHQSFSPKGTKRWELAHRTNNHIEAPRRTPVMAAHRCGIRIPKTRAPFPSPTLTPPTSTSPTPPF